jgi:hypothetical protein
VLPSSSVVEIVALADSQAAWVGKPYLKNFIVIVVIYYKEVSSASWALVDAAGIIKN